MMKTMKKLNIFLTGLALLMVGCTDDLTGFENGSQQTGTDGEMVDLTVSVSLDDLFPGGTRADDDDQYGHADKIDMLVYAVRQVNDGKIGAILTQYGKGVDASLKNYNGNGMAPALLAMGDDYLNQEDHTQTILNIKEDKNDEDGKIHINLRVMRGTTFNLSLWAQSAECTAYNFKTLEAVEVDYSKMKFGEDIHPDIYDAFSASANFSVGQVNTPIEVKLTRALSQINIGVNDEATDGNDADQFSKIEVAFKDIPTTLDVVNNTVKNEGQKDHTFSWDLSLNEKSKTFTVDNTNEAGQEPTTTKYKYLGMCYVLAPSIRVEDNLNQNVETPTVTVDKITVTKNGTPYYHSQKILAVNRNWRTNILFSRYKYLTPDPLNKETLQVPAKFTDSNNGIVIGNSIVWYPFQESYDVGLEAISGENVPEPYNYTYEITYYSSAEDPGQKLSVNRKISQTEAYNVTIPTDFLTKLDIKKEGDEYPKLKVKVVSLNEVFYSNSQETEMKLNVNWDTSQTYTWNFSGNSSYGEEDNLNGRAFYTYGSKLGSSGSKVSDTEFGGDDYSGLYYEAMQKSDRGWNFTGNSINGGGGITTNLHFKVNGSCNIKIKGVNSNTDNRDFIIDYGVQVYKGDGKDGFMLPADIDHANSNSAWDEKEGYAIILASNSANSMPEYFLDYNKVRAEGSKDFTNTPVITNNPDNKFPNGRYPNGETEYFSTKAEYVYLYFFGGTVNLYAITLSYPGSN